MGLFDIFSTGPADKAAADQSAAYDKQIGSLKYGYGTLGELYQQGRNSLSDSYSNWGMPLYNFNLTGMKGTNAYADATGANGQSGLDSAYSQFQSSPAYKSAVNLALDANDRRAASRGMLASGNTDTATSKLASDYANTYFNDYVKNLGSWLTPTESSGASLGYLGGTLGGALDTNYQNQGKAAKSTYENIGTAQANTGTAQSKADLAAYPASSNLWSGIIGGANALAGGFSGAGGFSSLGSSLGKGLGIGGTTYPGIGTFYA